MNSKNSIKGREYVKDSFYGAVRVNGNFPDPPETDNDVLGNIKFRPNSIEYYISYLC
jgi:hypothetical protein